VLSSTHAMTPSHGMNIYLITKEAGEKVTDEAGRPEGIRCLIN